ncbi:MAG: nicotinate phosphoribosyltransferase [Defluviicoccus sp.]|nr:nicotinate phosphoribosyltransferase [Defluviicoccus sp.]
MDLFANPLLTDLYQLNMMQSYLEHGMSGTAVFEFFCRKLPPRRNFLMAAGLAQAVEFLQTVRFSAADLDWLRGTGRFSADFLRYLEGFRFTGDADAMAEGTVFFPDEPLLRIIAPLPEAQFMETRLINLMQLQTVVASKAARMVLAAPNRTLIDFGLRRAHGAEAGLLAARAAYIAGFAGTATVLAGKMFGIPIFGTMAHAFIQAHDDETLAFERFARSRPDNLVLLIDTYDTEVGARKVVALAPRLKAAGIALRGVRLDSGDLASHARAVRAILDAGGLAEVKIFASGGLDEDRLAAFTADGVPIDGFGIGTSLVTSEDAPALDCAYKLQEYAGIPRRKRSEGKATWPGRKQVFRRYADDCTLVSDILTVEGDAQTGEPLLAPVVRAGCRVAPMPTLDAIRAHAAAQLDRLPAALRRLGGSGTCPVQVAPALRALAEAADRHTGIGTAGPA